MTDLERAGTDTADPSTQTPRPQNDPSPKRPWWKTKVGAAAVAAVLAAIGVSGYLGVRAVLAHPSSRTSSSTPSIDQVGGLPPGAAPCPRIQTDVQVPFNAGARGTPATSCGFVEQVRKEYSAHSTPTSGPIELSVISPATYKWYKLACFNSGSYVTCTGGAAAVIYLYNRPGSG